MTTEHYTTTIPRLAAVRTAGALVIARNLANATVNCAINALYRFGQINTVKTPRGERRVVVPLSMLSVEELEPKRPAWRKYSSWHQDYGL